MAYNFVDYETFLPLNNLIADPDGFITLCLQTIILKQKSVIVFCPTKKWCDTAAQLLSDALAKIRKILLESTIALLSASNQSVTQKVATLHADMDSKQLKYRKVINDLDACPVGLCPILKKTISEGVAYHHSGLTMDERKVLLSTTFQKNKLNNYV